MNVLSYEELNGVNGGGSKYYGLLFFLGGAIALVMGILNGYTHSKCSDQVKMKNYCEMDHVVGGSRYARDIILDFVFKELKRIGVILQPVRIFRLGVRK